MCAYIVIYIITLFYTIKGKNIKSEREIEEKERKRKWNKRGSEKNI